MPVDRDAIIAFRRAQLASVARRDEALAARTFEFHHTKNVKVSHFIKG